MLPTFEADLLSLLPAPFLFLTTRGEGSGDKLGAADFIVAIFVVVLLELLFLSTARVNRGEAGVIWLLLLLLLLTYS